MEDSAIHCIGCGDDMNAFSSHSLILESVRSNRCSARERFFFSSCVRSFLVCQNCTTKLAHSPWILLINCSVTNGGSLELQLLTEQRNPCTAGLLCGPGSPTESEHRLVL